MRGGEEVRRRRRGRGGRGDGEIMGREGGRKETYVEVILESERFILFSVESPEFGENTRI